MSKQRRKPGGYLDKILKLQRERPILQTAGVHHIEVRHDSWCALLQGTGKCNCHPEVSYLATEGRN